MALSQACPDSKLRVWARSERSAEAAAQLFPFVSCDAHEVAHDASLCVFCTPIGVMAEVAQTILPVLSENCVITDAGSVKAPVVEALEAILGPNFVGSHPMAGSERSGLSAARANLFQGAVSIVTPTPTSSPEAVAVVRDLWQKVGCRVTEMSPEDHDVAVSRVSHLPHAVAAALVQAIYRAVPDAGALAGGGYRDTTRVAAGPAGLWKEILLENRAALLAGLNDLTQTIDEMKTLITNHDASGLESFLARAKEIRDQLP